jgi:hypothetical protein
MSDSVRPTFICSSCEREYVLNELNTSLFTFDNADFNFYRIWCSKNCPYFVMIYVRSMDEKYSYLPEIVEVTHTAEPLTKMVEHFEAIFRYRPLVHRELAESEAHEAICLRIAMNDDRAMADLLETWASEAS